jgi:hypothetical protein
MDVRKAQVSEADKTVSGFVNTRHVLSNHDTVTRRIDSDIQPRKQFGTALAGSDSYRRPRTSYPTQHGKVMKALFTDSILLE